MKEQTYYAVPVVDKPLMDIIEKEALIAWFRCNSCLTCRFREAVVDNHDWIDIHKCSRMHDRHNIVDMVGLLGYSKE